MLNTFNSHHIKPVKNYNEAYQLCHLSLNAEDRQKWGAIDFELPVSSDNNLISFCYKHEFNNNMNK